RLFFGAFNHFCKNPDSNPAPTAELLNFLANTSFRYDKDIYLTQFERLATLFFEKIYRNNNPSDEEKEKIEKEMHLFWEIVNEFSKLHKTNPEQTTSCLKTLFNLSEQNKQEHNFKPIFDELKEINTDDLAFLEKYCKKVSNALTDLSYDIAMKKALQRSIPYKEALDSIGTDYVLNALQSELSHSSLSKLDIEKTIE